MVNCLIGWRNESSMTQDLAHYDTVASAFLATSSTMIALLGGLVPLFRERYQISSISSMLLFISLLLLMVTVILSILGLLTKTKDNKRVLCLIPSIPLMISITILFVSIML